MRNPRLTVTQESKTGMNERFRDNVTSENFAQSEVARRIDEGIYSGYQHYRNVKVV